MIKRKCFVVCFLTGWQPRWFVLDNGIISYYDSQDDVCKGSKGSIKMSVCEIKGEVIIFLLSIQDTKRNWLFLCRFGLPCASPVHPTDNTRLELIIPGEQHFYVRAVNAAERQKWLVALGSSKAGLIDTRTKKERGGSSLIMCSYLYICERLLRSLLCLANGSSGRQLN